MSDVTTVPGLRERKRLAMRRTIQVAVLTLVQQHGLDAVTVDMISRAADVSPRTFFNYFATKEDAVVGDAPELPEGPELERFVAAGDEPLLDGLVHLLDEAVDRSVVDRELVQLRRAVLKADPDLFARRVASVRSFEERLGALVLRRLERDAQVGVRPDGVGDDGPESVRSHAHLVTLVAMATLRHAWYEWVDDDEAHEGDDVRFGLRARLDASFATLERLVQRRA